MIYCYTLLHQAELYMGNECCNSIPHSKLQLSPYGEKDFIEQREEVNKLLHQVDRQRENSSYYEHSNSPNKKGFANEGYTIEKQSYISFQIQSKKRKYFAIDIIGAGSFGIVYRGYYKENDKQQQIAIKMFKCQTQERIKQTEASFDKQLEIYQKLQEGTQINQKVKLIDQCKNPQQMKFYLILKLQNHQSLNKFLKKGMNQHMVSDLLLSILSQLHNWQQKSLIHMDIKSSNILITLPDIYTERKEPLAILTDYGLSQKADEQTWNKIKFRKIGTRYHQAPELVQNLYPNVSYSMQNLLKLDIFSLGVTLYQWLTSASSKQPVFYGSHIPQGQFERYSYEFYSMKQKIENKDQQIMTFFIKRHQMWQLILTIMLQPNPQERCSLIELSEIFKILYETYKHEIHQKQEDYKSRTDFSQLEWNLLILRIIMDNYIKYLSKIKQKNEFHYGVIKYLAQFVLIKSKQLYMKLFLDKNPYYNSLPQQCVSNTKPFRNPSPSTILNILIHLKKTQKQETLGQKLRKCISSFLNLYDTVAFQHYLTNTYKEYMNKINKKVDQLISQSIQQGNFQSIILEQSLKLQKSVADKIMKCLNSDNKSEKRIK